MKVALVTGANRGLGKGFVEYLLTQDYRIFAGVRDPEKTTFTQNNVTAIPLDVADDESIKHAFSLVKAEIQTLDLLINNAGTNKESATNNRKELVSKLDKMDRSIMLRMFDINSVSPLLVLKQFSPLMSQDSFVINVSSDRASFHDEFENSNGNYGYRASKIALNMLTFCSLYDLPKGVRTFAVHPGSVRTDMNPTGDYSPKEQAEKIIAITKNWKQEFNGKFLRYDGTLYPL